MDTGAFWAKVDQGGGGCWEWRATRNADGYGQWTDCRHGPSGRGRKLWKAHRLAWTLAHGPIPEGLLVCHHCDNPPCCNPAHLFLGTPLDNARDKVSKGRMRRGDFRGTANGHARLTEDQVIEIRALVAAGTPQARMVERYGVHPMTVSQIVTRKTWRHLP